MFAATPPDFASSRNRFSPSRNRTPRGPPGSSDSDHVESYWKDGYPVLKKKEGSSVHAFIPVIAPITAPIRIKSTIYTLLNNKLQAAEGRWSDKVELFYGVFENIVPIARTQADIATQDLRHYDSNVFLLLLLWLVGKQRAHFVSSTKRTKQNVFFWISENRFQVVVGDGVATTIPVKCPDERAHIFQPSQGVRTKRKDANGSRRFWKGGC